MARYIDADALREPLTIIIKNAEAKELYNIAFNYEHCLKMIDDTPTADVAPRAEVAREIFEEIEGSIAVHAFTSKSEDYVDGMYDAIEWVDSKIAELKNKYAEGRNDT